MGKICFRARRGVVLGLLVCGALLAVAANASAALPPIKHVFLLIDENENAATTFGAGSPAPYLSQTLRSQGAFIPNYYGIGHASLDNYIAMVSGQAPNTTTSGDCPTFTDFIGSTGLDASGQETGTGCVYPSNVPTLMSQFNSTGSLTWRGYMDGMGTDPVRDGTGTGTSCGHPAVGSPDVTIDPGPTPTDQYATRHDPFVYFHSVIDNTAQCNANVVNLSQLPSDLASVATTPNYTFITPNSCNDGHDAPCANGGPGGLTQADTFLKTWVPIITSSPAYKQDGVLIITFDEATSADASACCGETPGPGEALPGVSGPGGGLVGAVVLSRYITPGTITPTAYNHYSMLGTIEDLFGVPRLGAAAGTPAFGADVFSNPSGNPPVPTPTPTPTPAPVAPEDSALNLTPASFKAQPTGKPRKGRGTRISYRDTQAATTKLTVVRTGPAYRVGKKGACKLLATGHKRPKHSKVCTAAKTIGSFNHVDKAGANSITFSGRLGGHALAAGSYVLRAAPKLGSLTGKTVSAGFKVR
ncbi:MAG TPA: alkaline phosphatase family protein [Solirubrobacteraceae bacterium]|jgi:hypothetical protein|nr:alkaline phosphatase family protein [Solirubrobacteraceae bacterium]